jgi:hypothetical protein|tara:strand:- start:198 stop:842 length:645 start_codon:yes stop_codon:yes gene_type:complete
MSQLEQKFSSFIARHTEIRPAYSQNLLNIRAVARTFMKEENVNTKQIEAVVAMIRRFDVKPLIAYTEQKIFSDIKISIKDEIVIFDYEKSDAIIEKLKEVVSEIDSNKNETLKVVVGSISVKIIVDSSNSALIKQKLEKANLHKKYSAISEISLLFSQKALEEKGIIAYVTSELLLGGINIQEIITCTPELILYVDEEQSLKTYEILKRIKKQC